MQAGGVARSDTCPVKVMASVYWIPEDAGGRKAPPAGSTYITSARFQDQSEAEWLRQSWSIVLEFTSSIDSHNTQMAAVRFLVPDAPTAWLFEGNRFSMHEGWKRTADCVIVSVDDP